MRGEMHVAHGRASAALPFAFIDITLSLLWYTKCKHFEQAAW